MIKWKFVQYTFYIVAIWFIGHIFFISIDGLRDEGKSGDLALILGNKVNTDWSLSKRLEKRLECGLNLYKNGRVKKLLVSGGFGKEGFYEWMKMREYLMINGVPDNSIIVDNLWNNTIASVENTLKLKDGLNYKSIIVVSQYFHVTRTKMLFRERGFYEVSSVSPLYFEMRDIYSLIREFFAYYFG